MATTSVGDKKPGSAWKQPKYEDGCTVITNSVTDNAALAATGGMTVAAYEALRAAPETYGLLELGPANGAIFHFGATGSDNDSTATYLLCWIKPVYAKADTEKKTVLGYVEVPLEKGAITLCALTVGADLLAALGGNTITAISSTDLLADTITATLSAAGVWVYSPGSVTADLGAASLRVTAPEGAVALRMKLKRGTPTRIFCFGNRCGLSPT